MTFRASHKNEKPEYQQAAFKVRMIAGVNASSGSILSVVNVAPLGVLRDSPVFEHDPSGMFTNSIPQTLQNRILAKGIPALSEPLGRFAISEDSGIHSKNQENMNAIETPNGWCRNSTLYGDTWLHSDIQNVAYFYTFKLFDILVSKGGCK